MEWVWWFLFGIWVLWWLERWVFWWVLLWVLIGIWCFWSCGSLLWYMWSMCLCLFLVLMWGVDWWICLWWSMWLGWMWLWWWWDFCVLWISMFGILGWWGRICRWELGVLFGSYLLCRKWCLGRECCCIKGCSWIWCMVYLSLWECLCLLLRYMLWLGMLLCWCEFFEWRRNCVFLIWSICWFCLCLFLCLVFLCVCCRFGLCVGIGLLWLWVLDVLVVVCLLVVLVICLDILVYLWIWWFVLLEIKFGDENEFKNFIFMVENVRDKFWWWECLNLINYFCDGKIYIGSLDGFFGFELNVCGFYYWRNMFYCCMCMVVMKFFCNFCKLRIFGMVNKIS